MRLVLLVIWFLVSFDTIAQPVSYTASNAHSHNDYEQPVPFYEAYSQQFGSIEADIFLRDGKLLVAHQANQLDSNKTLSTLYLQPLLAKITKNNGSVYADTSRRLQLMIDVKTSAEATLQALVQLLAAYPMLTQCNSLQLVISGNRPDPELFSTYPTYILFDGELNKTYSTAALQKIVMLSDNFKRYSAWNGKDNIPGTELEAIQQGIAKAHALGKKVRFWNAPDSINSWRAFMTWGVDYINTDQVAALAAFIKSDGK
ncbi:MAG: phosphatidylinositol-specific phospholipase C/glycerophosphodiester phosphodiesterase family protein [Chitinophagaceae bacterium]